MGQQQLLLIVLGIIIVGIAIAVGVNMFQSSAVDTNRQAMIGDLANLAAKAQRFYRTPTELGGGGQSFVGFKLGRLEIDNGNGTFRVRDTEPTAAEARPADVVAGGTDTAISTDSDTTIYIIAWGNEFGDDASMNVEAATAVTPTRISTNILN